MFLPSLLHSCRALLSRYKWRLNKVSNKKILRRFCGRGHCLNLMWLVNLQTTISWTSIKEGCDYGYAWPDEIKM